MKKSIIGFLVILGISQNLIAEERLGIGTAFGSPNLLLNILVPVGKTSLDIDLGWSWWGGFSNTSNSFFSAIDIILLKSLIANDLYFFLGIGPRFGFWNTGNSLNNEGSGGIYIGPRVPLGLDWRPVEHLSLFFKVAPGLQFSIAKNLFSPNLSLDFGLGVRIIF